MALTQELSGKLLGEPTERLVALLIEEFAEELVDEVGTWTEGPDKVPKGPPGGLAVVPLHGLAEDVVDDRPRGFAEDFVVVTVEQPSEKLADEGAGKTVEKPAALVDKQLQRLTRWLVDELIQAVSDSGWRAAGVRVCEIPEIAER